jgi:hypothetical protein
VARKRNRSRTPQPAATPPPSIRSLAVAGLLLACIAGPVGVVISLTAFLRSRRQGEKNTVAVVGMMVGVATTAAFVGGIFYFQAVFSGQVGVCADLGPGTHEGVFTTFTCPSD